MSLLTFRRMRERAAAKTAGVPVIEKAETAPAKEPDASVLTAPAPKSPPASAEKRR